MKLLCCKPVREAVHDPLNQRNSAMRLGERRADGDVHCPGRRGSARDERSGNFCWRQLRVLTRDESEAAQRVFKEKGRSIAAYDSGFCFFRLLVRQSASV